MLMSIRDKVTGWLAYVIIFLISIPFALWGLQDYLNPSANSYAAKVADNEISMRTLDAETLRYRQQLQEMFGGKLPPLLANDSALKQQVLERLISSEVLDQLTKNNGYAVGDAQLAALVSSMQVFLKDEHFDKELYSLQLRSQGLTEVGFEQRLRRATRMDQLRQGLAASSFSLGSQVEDLSKLLQQERSVSYITLPLKNALSEVSISDASIDAEYEKNPKRYMSPQRVKVSYIELSADQLGQDIDVDEDTLKATYEERRDQYGAPEEREARHLLVKLSAAASDEEQAAAKQKIDGFYNKAVAGEDFSALAKQSSEDMGSAKKGGALGVVSRGIMVKPFEDVLFALALDEVSRPVKTQFGWHIIVLDKIHVGDTKSFAEMRAGLLKEFKLKGAENLFFDKAEHLANLSYENPDSLLIASEVLAVPVAETDWFTQDQGTGIALDPKLRSMAFSSDLIIEGRNSDLIEYDGRVLVIRVKEYEVAKPLAKNKVRDSIFATLKQREARVILRDKGKALLEKLAGRELSEFLAKEASGKYVDVGFVNRENKRLPAEMSTLAFSMEKPSATGTHEGMSLSSGDYVVIEVA
ncbi:MAG: SurA N-terminal domain-containing protein, partial [Gammaproteobacteria bacterium]|nr:SurA N-terminal domain-containing protein [Gammaproteobacteria bacterium]